jgi:hypothetical protein
VTSAGAAAAGSAADAGIAPQMGRCAMAGAG